MESTSSSVEGFIDLEPTFRIAVKCWHPGPVSLELHEALSVAETRVVALHGWLDNCETFTGVAPILASQGQLTVLGIDFPVS